jgi:hypothetical protein
MTGTKDPAATLRAAVVGVIQPALRQMERQPGSASAQALIARCHGQADLLLANLADLETVLAEGGR